MLNPCLRSGRSASGVPLTVINVKVNSKWISDAEIELSKQQTRNNPQRTRRHHFVPQMYLKRWTGEDEQILSTDIDTHESTIGVPDDIANEEYFYQIVGDDIDTDEHPDLWFETHMGRIEGKAAGWLRALDGLPNGRIKDPNLTHNLAVFVALQSQRTPRRRDAELDLDAAIARFGARNILNDRVRLPRMCRALGLPYSPERHFQIIDEIIAKPDFSTEPKAKIVDNCIKVWRNRIAPLLACQRVWWLVSSDTSLATCDEPVISIPAPGWPRGKFPKFDSTLILYPIGPHRLLVATTQEHTLTGPLMLSPEEANAVNFEVATNGMKFMYEHPGSDIAAHISVPSLPPFDPSDALTFWDVVDPPTRWRGTAQPPDWPLQRWTT